MRPQLFTLFKCHTFVILTCLSIILTISGCGSNTTNQKINGENKADNSKSTQNFSVPLPPSLSKHLVSGDKLSAVLIIDKGTKSEQTRQLIVNHTTNKVIGTVDDLEAGTHSFEIVYYIDSGGKPVEVATAKTNATVAAGPNTAPTPITFAGSDLRYTDSDGDGLTNLAELEIGTKYNDPADRPITDLLRSSQNYVLSDIQTELLRSSLNYVLSDTQGVNPTDGKTTVVGESKSANYTLY